jgi:hypothetical protein
MRQADMSFFSWGKAGGGLPVLQFDPESTLPLDWLPLAPSTCEEQQFHLEVERYATIPYINEKF